MFARRLWLFATFVLTLWCSAALAQSTPSGGPLRSSVVVVNTDELYQRTLFGQRIAAELEERARVLQAENEQLTAALTQEEQQLTEQRETMEPDAFRQAAAEFDTRVQGIRRSRDAAIAKFEEERQSAPTRFLEQVRVILGELMVERGAAVLLNQQVALLSLSAVDITDQAVQRIDEQLGDGTPTAETTEPTQDE